jgi:hypothetical protein
VFPAVVVALAAAGLALPAGAAKISSAKGEVKPVVLRPVGYGVSAPVRDMRRLAPSAPVADSGEFIEVPTLPLPKGEMRGAAAFGRLFGQDSDAALQSFSPPRSTPSPALTFDGLNNFDNANAFGFRVLPPDTNGDVGPNHYVQMVNLLFRVYDKSGAPLTPPTKLSSLFAPLGGVCSTNDNGDPVVLYDPLADRWLLSQFGFTAQSSPPYHECVAISMTGDPTGAYFLYDFVTPGNEFPDYPKFGVWPDAYYMTVNQFTNGGPFNGTGAYAFDRAQMLVGSPTAGLIYFNLNLASHPEGIGGTLPSDLDGPAPPPGSPNVVSYPLADEFGDALDALRLFDFHVDWAVPANSTFTERPESPLAVAAYNPMTPPGRDDIQQPPPSGSTTALDSISDRLMHRLQYRNFGTYESLVVTQTVNVGSGNTLATYQAGVRYYQLTRSGGAFSVAEQSTFAPDTDSRWMGSAAMDGSGDLAVGYSVSSVNTYPSIRYAARVPSDPHGGLFQGEASLQTGLGSQLNTASRWGDYSALSVDPSDDCTFWYTTEYYNATTPEGTILCSSTGTFSNACWSTRIGNFRIPTCIAGVTVSKDVLWPPNHKLVMETVDYTVGSGATCALSVMSNEPINGTGDGDTSPDWVIVDDHHVKLRAERAGGGTGRVYTIKVTCTDGGGNSSNPSSIVVTVPHDKGK